MIEDDEIIREFLIESNENLNRLDAEIVDLERQPTSERLASIFRTIHTIKGTCGFLDFHILEGITHHAENILSQLRAGQRQVTGNLVSLILESVDAVRQILGNIETSGAEGSDTYPDLVQRLERAAADSKEASEQQVVETAVETPPSAPAKIQLPTVAIEALNDKVEKPPLAVAQPAAAETEKSTGVADSSIRVDVSLLDKLMNLVGELVLARNQILQFSSQRDDTALNATSQRLNLITSELQEGVMKTRMQPIGMIWNKLPRVVRDVAHALGKQLELEMEGADTELDKTIIEAVKDPITHMVRNACDHGIETPEIRLRKGKTAKGTLRLKAYHEGGQVNIEISDDGSGIDLERVKSKAVDKGLIRAEQAAGMTERDAIALLFLPGFSTAQTVTNVSGRGVGMDVVKSNVEKIGGAVDISTRPGHGTTVKLKIPLTLAIIPGLLVSSGGHRFVIPQISLLELIRLEGEGLSKIEFVHQTPVYRRRGTLLPVAYLNEVLKLPETDSGRVRNMVVLQAEDRQFGLVVDGVNDTQEIVVKPLGKQLKGLVCYSGSTIMGDGAVALILDVLGIGHLSGVLNRSREAHRQEIVRPVTTEGQKQRLLVFKSGSFERLAVPLELVARLEEIPLSSIEYASGRRVVQYRQQILPLIPLSSVIDAGSAATDQSQLLDQASANPVQVIVFTNEDKTIGLIVDQIVDIVEESITMRRPASPRPGILGSAVVGRKVADFLDLQAVIEASGERSFGLPETRPSKILLAESSTFNRSLLRVELEMSGYEVIEATSTTEALQAMDRQPIQVLVVGGDVVLNDAAGLKEVRKYATSFAIPMLALTNSTGELQSRKASGPHFDDYQLRFERDAMLQSIARLASVVHSTRVSDSSFSAESEQSEKATELVHA